MAVRRIGIRELKATLSERVKDVKAGATLIVTEHGKPVARIIPETGSLRQRLEALTDAGRIAWSGRRLAETKPTARGRGRKTIADLVSENRE